MSKVWARPLAVAGVGLLLVGCATPPGGTAMQVNDARISTADVDRAASDCANLVHTTKDKVRTQVATMYLQGLIAQELAAQNGVQVSDAARTAQVASNGVGPLMDSGACQAVVDKWLTIKVLEQDWGAPKIISEAAHLDIQVNPQFGPFQAESLSLPGGSGSLSSAASSAPVTPR